MKGFEMNNCSKQASTFWMKETLEFVPLSLLIFFFLTSVFERDYLKILCCTRTINTVFSSMKENVPGYCLPNQRFNFNMLFFPIFWRDISEKILHVLSLLLLRSPRSSSVCGFSPGITSLVAVSIPH